MEDKDIVNLYWQRDEQAIKQTQIKYGNYCYTIANNILFNNEDSQEVLNDTYLAVWNAIPDNRPTFLSTFIGKITRRLSLKKYRSKTAKKRGSGQSTISLDELEECIPDNNSIDKALNEQYLTELIDNFLQGLKTIDRKIFVCRYWYFDSIQDIAQRFHFTESKVKMNLKRNRDKLKDYLIKQGVFINEK